jgi:glycosyltransferase involved in cell wall biosynthesis
MHSLHLILLFAIIFQLEVILLSIWFNTLQKNGEEPKYYHISERQYNISLKNIDMSVMRTTNRFIDKNLLVITPLFPDENDQYIGGNFVKYQIDALKKYFHGIIVIAPVLSTLKISQNDRLCHNYCYDNIHIYYPRCFYVPWKIQRIWPLNKYLIDFRLHAVEKTIANNHISFDLIHAHFSWPSTYIGAKLNGKYHTPTIATIHEDTKWLNEEIGFRLNKLEYAWSNVNGLIRPTDSDVAELKQFNENIWVIPNGFTPRFKQMHIEECRSKLQLPKDKKIIFSLGTVTERKGYSYLIDAIHAITQQRDDVMCFIGGPGPLIPKLRNKINNLGLSDRIILTDYISDDQLPLWMNACDMFVLPSLSESFGIVQIEAMACGKPVVATKNGGSEGIIISDDYGYLCEPGDARSLAEAICKALETEWSPQLILAYAERFHWDNVAKALLSAYDEIIAQK